MSHSGLSISFFEGFYLLVKNLWQVLEVYWLQIIILGLLLILLFFSLKAAKKETEPSKGAGWKILRGIRIFFVSLFRLILQSPLLLLFVLLLIFFRSPKLSRFFLKFLEGLGIPVKENSDKTEFEAKGESPHKDDMKAILKEGKQILIPPAAVVKEMAMKDLKAELHGKISHDYKKVPNTYVYQAIYIPDVGKRYTLPVWVHYRDILAVVEGNKKNQIIVLVRQQARPTQAKREWDALANR